VTESTSIICENTGQPNSGAENYENWIVFPSKQQLFVHAQRNQEIDDKITISEKSGWWSQYAAISALGRLSDVNDMGFVCVYLPSEADSTRLLQGLVKVSERKSFSVISMQVPLSLDECLSIFGAERTASNKFPTAQFKPILLQ